MPIEELLAVSHRPGRGRTAHHGSWVVVRDGAVVESAGDPARPTTLRSTAKPFQALPVVAEGAAAAYALGAKELAVLCASHNGEPIHVETVRGMLRRAGLPEAWLRTPTGRGPTGEPARKALEAAGEPPGPVHDTCSGKHAGMMLLANFLRLPVPNYWQAGHAVQELILSALARAADVSRGRIGLRTDGCGVPAFILPLERLALAYSRLGDPSPLGAETGAALAALRSAIAEAPELYGGTGRLDTDAVRATKGRVIPKVGAGGLYAAAVSGEPVGLALKIEGGDERIAGAVLLRLLERFGLLAPAEKEALAPHAAAGEIEVRV